MSIKTAQKRKLEIMCCNQNHKCEALLTFSPGVNRGALVLFGYFILF